MDIAWPQPRAGGDGIPEPSQKAGSPLSARPGRIAMTGGSSERIDRRPFQRANQASDFGR